MDGAIFARVVYDSKVVPGLLKNTGQLPSETLDLIKVCLFFRLFKDIR